MGDPSSSARSSTSLVDLDMDALARCASYLSLRDISNMAMSCKHLNRAAYSDSVWQSLYRREWPQVGPLWSQQESSIRDAFLSSHIALRQFKYVDPLVREVCIRGLPPLHMLFDKNSIILSKGSSIQSLNTDDLNSGASKRGLHSARITCMRLFSLNETSLHRNQSDRDDNVLITSSADRFVRLWWKGGSRCFKGHTGPVSTISDRVLGDDNGKIFASGGEDKTVRLWSINSTGKRGHLAPKATLHGHGKTVSLISVAGHKQSLLVSISTNGKVFVWDTNEASSSTRSCSVGTTSVPSAPVGMKCHESLVHVAAGSSVVSVDLRTMQSVSMLALPEGIHSFEALPSKFLFCTGGTSSAKLWDIRRMSNKAEPTAVLGGHIGPIKLLHMDPYKIVTGGPYDPDVNIWASDTGVQTNSLSCAAGLDESEFGCYKMAVDGCRIVTASTLMVDHTFITYRDFTTATCSVPCNASEASGTGSKFWRFQSDGESEESDGEFDGE